MTIISPNKDVEGRLSDIVHKEHDWFWRHEGSENLLAYIALVASGSGLSAESATEDKVLDAIASSPVSEDLLNISRNSSPRARSASSAAS